MKPTIFAGRWTTIALALPLLFVTACGGAQKRVETPEPEAASASEPKREARATPDPTIQSASVADTSPTPAPPAPNPKGPPPQASNELEARIISGAALPPTSNAAPSPANEKPPKAKKPSKGRKKGRS